MSSSSTSLIEKLRNKPKAKQKERFRVGIKGAPKEKVQIRTKIVNKLDEGIVSNREELLEKFKTSKAIVSKVTLRDSAPVSQRPSVPETKKSTKPSKTVTGSTTTKVKRKKGKKLKLVGITKGTVSTPSNVSLDKPKRKLTLIRKTKQPDLSVIAELDEEDVIEGVLIDPKRLPSNEPSVNIRASSYYLNNREIFMTFINSLFSQYRDDLLDDAADVSCEARKESTEFSLLTHQRIVRDYLNLYTPYRGLLLYHGLGSGKTCSSIAIAEGMKTAKNVIVMTPASLRRNYIEELKKCGDSLYKKNQYWEFISTGTTETNMALAQDLSSVLSLSVKWIKKNRGAWLVDVRKPSNYESLSTDDRINLDNQLNEMIRDKYQFINYNGLRNDTLDQHTANGDINLFDNKVVIIDEAHNFVSRIVNKMGKQESISQRLYEYLMMAENCRIVLLTGTPIINYPNEIGILFNILRGYIKTFTVPVNVKSESRVDLDRIKSLIATNKDLSGIIDFIEYKPASKQIVFTRNPFGFANIYNKKKYDGVATIGERGELNDNDLITTLAKVLGGNGVEILRHGIKIDLYKSLPDDLDQFKSMFIEADGSMKNSGLFKRRILGLSSYFKSAQETLMPEFDKDKNIHVIKIDMSQYQFGIYESARVAERKQETSNKKKKKRKGPDGELYDDSVSTYRIFSRAFCNFVFPRPIGRPMPGNEAIIMAAEEFGEAMQKIINDAAKNKLDEDELDAATTEERLANVDGRYTEDDRKDLESGKKDLQNRYQQSILQAMSELKENADFYLTPEGKDGSGGLAIYSPKFLHILENIVDPEHVGLHLIYSQFRTIEGVGVLKLVLEANGFVQFKLKKSSNGNWEINIKDEDKGKPTFALYTGTEDQEEKELIRNIFNGTWEYVPNNIVTELNKISSNNLMGEVIKVFMITASGAEGISLRNTRYVHVVEPYWHPVRMEQVIGRARRICSHEDLPAELRTVDVFLYLMTFSEEQLTSDESIELRLKDKGKLTERPLTSDEALYEISNIKSDINGNLLNAIKESAMDCSLHSRADSKEPIVCYSFGRPSREKFAYYPALEREEKDVVAKINVEKITWKAKEVTISGKKYAYRKETGEVYDLDSYKQAIRVPGAQPLLKGRLEKDVNKKLKFIRV